MTDPNDQWAAFNPQAATPAASSGPVYGAPAAPKEATPQTPAQELNTRTNAAQGQQSIALTPPKAAADFIKDFNADPAVKGYREVLPMVIAATQAGHNGAGDASVVYGWAKAMDPMGSVREGDTQMAQGTAGPVQQAELLISQYHLQQGGTLPPQVRHGLIEEMRNKGRQLDLQYSDKYKQYQHLLSQAGLDPSILGPHEGDKYRAAEEAYVRSVNGASQGPTDPSFVAMQGGRTIAPDATEGVFGNQGNPAGYLPPGADKIPDQLKQALASGEIPPDPYAIMGWAQQHGGYTIPLKDAQAAAETLKKGVVPSVNPVTPYKPDITDVRGGQNTSGQDSINATARGVLDVPTMGALDKIVAAGDTLTKGGTYDQNLSRQYAISDYDQQQHPFFRMGGQALGGALLPFGAEASLPRVIGEGAGYGAAYGTGSSRSLGDVPQNAMLGGVAGAAVPAVLGGAGRAINALRGGEKGVPPLVDPATGELLQPMDAMAPGQRAQQFQDYGFRNTSPGMVGGRTARVMEQGLNNLPGSAGIMEDFNSAVSGDARRAMQNVAQQAGSSKTLNEGGAELQRGAKQYIARADSVASKLYNAIPISDKAPSNLTNTTAALQQLSGKFSSNPDMAEMLNNPKFAQYLDAIQKHGLSWQDLKDLRTMVGEKIGDMRFGENDSTKDFRGLYGALSEDMKNTAASQGPQAIRAFERANNFYSQKESMIESSLSRILGPDSKASPERAAAAVQAMTKGGKATGDLKTLAQVRAATIKSGAWDEIASTLIHLGGQPANSEGRAFNPQTFVQWYADMSEPARAMLFKPELRKSLDGFVGVSQQLSRVKGLTNTSNTTPTMIGSGLIAAGGVAAVSHPAALLAIVGGGIANNVMARVWTNPTFVRLATGYTKAAASGNLNAVRSQVGRLTKLATANPELRQGIEALLKNIANDNAPRMGQVAASPNQGPDQQQ